MGLPATRLILDKVKTAESPDLSASGIGSSHPERVAGTFPRAVPCCEGLHQGAPSSARNQRQTRASSDYFPYPLAVNIEALIQ